METPNEVGPGVAGRILPPWGVAWFGYISNNDALFQFGMVAIVLLSLHNAAL